MKFCFSCIYLYNPFTLNLYFWKYYASISTTNTFVSWLACYRGNICDQLAFHDFTDNLFVVLFSLSAHIFLHLCCLKMVRIFWDVIHFSLTCLEWNKPLGLWSSLLLTAIITVSWLLIGHFTAHLLGHLTRETLEMLAYIQLVSDPVDSLN